MSDEIKFRKEYQDTFNEVHAPVKLSRKVMNMKEAKKTSVFYIRKFATAVAIALVVFICGNGITYAATGNSLFATVKVYLNGSEYKAKLEQKVDEDSGQTYYEGTFEDVKGTLELGITDTDSKQNFYEVAVDTVTVAEENGKIYLVDGEWKLDITEDAKDGSASGTYEKDELNYEYEVIEKDGAWEVHVSSRTDNVK